MISPSDRQQAVTLIDEAHRTGARLSRACAEIGLTVRTYQRWTQGTAVKVDGRPGAVRPAPANKLNAAEQAAVLAICHEPQ
jgi:putative transposase